MSVRAIQDRETWKGRLSEQEEDVLAELPSAFILGASRFVRYKKLEEAIRVGEAARMPVVIAGAGPDGQYLRQAAASGSVKVRFIDAPSDAMLYALYEHADVFVFAAVEDFGIMPVEAMAAGTPVIVNSIGGAREPVERIGGGAVLRGSTDNDIRRALKEALSADRDSMRVGAQAFDAEEFDSSILRWKEESIA
ncbi:glycosyltransferase involved in cell wall biosynthesis [Agromyces terreus]|uniref:D-inositol 3-phosphate glycosyltransferase n=1 Tax=Agromyces terreus TaxID=424795 RepID=A0A9X2GXW6_9MICO|nr:glycosyltransferase [Agromyces terreus]MCP2369471.1 glycosyltransferase involved in cell wall biosynthesis [Agromyces terreus]